MTRSQDVDSARSQLARLLERRWTLVLAGIVVIGLLVRAAYVVLVANDLVLGLDAVWYRIQAGSIRNGTGFINPSTIFREALEPTAGFPPAYPAYLAFWQWTIGSASLHLSGLLPAAATVTLTALLGKAVAGVRVGLLAAAFVALDPTLVAVDGSSMSENLSVPIVLGTLVLGQHFVSRPAPWPARIGVGCLCGIAALTRADLILLVPLLAGVAIIGVLDVHRPRLGHRLIAGALVLAGAAAVVVPWAWRNERQLGVFAVATTSPSSALAGANCASAYEGEDIGSWSFDCVVAATPTGTVSERQIAAAQRAAATAFAREHVRELPVVFLARQARVWAFWDRHDLARRDAEETRSASWQRWSRPIDAVLLLTGVVGLFRLWSGAGRFDRRAPTMVLLVAPVGLVAATATASYGNPRFNAIAHPALAVGLAVLVSSRAHRRDGSRDARAQRAGSGS